MTTVRLVWGDTRGGAEARGRHELNAGQKSGDFMSEIPRAVVLYEEPAEVGREKFEQEERNGVMRHTDVLRAGCIVTTVVVVLAQSSSLRADCEVWEPIGEGFGGSFVIVEALETFDGELIAGGAFTNSGGQPLSNIARWDGRMWHPMGTFNNRVIDLTVYNGELIAAGQFTSGDGQPLNLIARWDGEMWQPLGSGISGTWVQALTVYNGDLIAGGLFEFAGGILTLNIARWDGAAWHPLGALTGGSVRALTVHDGDLIAGGWFTHIDFQQPAHRIARWDGTGWHPIGDSPTINSGVLTLTGFEGDLVAAGNFTSIGGQLMKVGRWDGKAWHAIGDPEIPSLINAVTVYNDSLIATNLSSTDKDVRRWNGESWNTMGGSFTGSTGGINGELLVDGDHLIVGGIFDAVDGVTANGIARWQDCLATPCPGDLNRDEVVDVQDLQILIDDIGFGPCAPGDPCPGDLNGDDSVDVSDLLILLSGWGACE